MDAKNIIFFAITLSMFTLGCMENPSELEKINKTVGGGENVTLPANNSTNHNGGNAGKGIQNFSCDVIWEASGDRDICEASLTGNASFCESISTENIREECYRIFAINEVFENRTGNAADICNTYISNPGRKYLCLAAAKSDPSICRSIDRNTSQEGRDLCFYSVAVFDKVRNTSDRLEICSNINDFTSRQICATVISGNAHYCDDNLDLDKFLVDCYLEFAAFGNISKERAEYVCSAIKGDSKYFCLARVRGDTTMCDSIADGNLRNTCYLYVVLYRNYRHNN